MDPSTHASEEHVVHFPLSANPTKRNESEMTLMSYDAGTTTPLFADQWRWTSEMASNLRFRFDGSSSILSNHSQAWQDVFVLAMLNGKREGRYLEIGAHVPVENNNTFLLASQFGWSGVSVELDTAHFPLWLRDRPGDTLLLANALELDYRKLLSTWFGSSKERIDYLQLDIDPSINTLNVLKQLPMDEWRFSVITFEHDGYTGDHRARDESREIFLSNGYAPAALDVSVLFLPVSNAPIPFEDWWIDPAAVTPATIETLKSIHNDIRLPQELLFS
jgi:hypothetical protein